MKKKKLQRILLLQILFIIVVPMWGISSTNAAQDKKITIDGSTTVYPIATRCASEFTELKKGSITFNISATGSSHGVSSIISGLVDIGMASRRVKQTEFNMKSTMVEHIIALDGIAIILNKANQVPQLTLNQLKKIYNGTFTNWNELGGLNNPIVIYNREEGSGTRDFFKEAVLISDQFVNTAILKESNELMKEAVQNDINGIAYIGLGYVDSLIKSVLIENEKGVFIEPTENNVLNGEYPIARELVLITDGNPTGDIKEFIDFVLSPDGQRILEEEGFVPINKGVLIEPWLLFLSVIGSTTFLTWVILTFRKRKQNIRLNKQK